jgi:hypothetical protein
LLLLSFILFEILITLEAPGIARNLPTPHLGIWERVNVGAFMLWLACWHCSFEKGKDSKRKAIINKVVDLSQLAAGLQLLN